MGKQINFYMDKKVEDEFIKFIYKIKFEVLEENEEKKRIESYKKYDEFNPKGIQLFLYKKNYGNIVKLKNCDCAINSISSPVIEFMRTIIIDCDKEIVGGRIWYEQKYYNNDGELIKKNEQILKDYNMLVRWIKKNTIYTDVNNLGFTSKYYVTKEIEKILEKNNYVLI